MTGAYRGPARLASVAPLLLAGLLPMNPDVPGQWNVAGRWTYPVGDPCALGQPGPDGDPGYGVTRNVARAPSDRHLGADLSNRQGGGLVRAAAHGVVVAATDAGNGYGRHVVIAHRLPHGEMVVSIYAHLAAASVQVKPGQPVTVGQVVGRVGMTGVATSPHLHFEIRRPRELDQRWEKAEAVDPVAFVAARLPTRLQDSTWARPYLAWAECAGFLTPQDDPLAPVGRGQWRRALATILCRRMEGLPDSTATPNALLADAGVLSSHDPLDPLDPVSWSEVVRDLRRARRAGLCLPPDSSSGAERRDRCRLRLGAERPSSHLEALGRRKGLSTLADIALLLSDAASP